jgi:diguanylate cyclase (GGDEF)-like protein
MLVLNQVINTQYGEISGKANSHAELIKLEQETLGLTHAEVGAILAEQWKLPPILATSVGASHDPSKVSDPALRKIAQVVQIAGQAADVFVDAAPAESIVQVRSTCAAAYRTTDADCDQLLQEISVKTKEVIPLFEINIGSVANYEAILKKANEALVELTLESQMQNTKLQQQNEVLHQRATTDGLTGLSNRAMFDEIFQERFTSAKGARQPLTLLMMDLDQFKLVNDRFGHPAGDQVLSSVAKILQAAARAKDLVARYGGEEMAMVLPETPRHVAAAIAETIRLAIAKQPIRCNGVAIPVTISIGVATLEPGSAMTEATHLLKAADMAVYTAKRSGRNCVKICSLAAPAAA